MHLSIHTQGIVLTDFITRVTYQKIELALDRIADDIELIRVELVDINGPYLGGIDKVCRIEVQIRDQDSILVEDLDEEVDTVIDRTTDRLGMVACKRWNASNRPNTGVRSWLLGAWNDDPLAPPLEGKV
jgi:hypothetical protein